MTFLFYVALTVIFLIVDFFAFRSAVLLWIFGRPCSFWRWVSNDFQRANVVFQGIIATAGFLAVIVGVSAYRTYNQQNDNLIQDRLQNLDQNMSDKITDKPRLSSIFVARPINDEPKVAMNRMLKIFLTNPEEIENIPQFDNIKKFSCNFWSAESNYRYDDLIDAYFFAESILYIVNAAHDNKDVYIENSDRYLIDEYPYIGEVGENPVFLAALFEGVRWGYLSENASEWMRENIVQNFTDEAYWRQVFPEMLDPKKWRKLKGREACDP